MKTKLNITYPAFALFALACFALAPQVRAVCRDGCDIANNNTFLGDNALINNTTGQFNTAIGRNALLSNTTGISNTATGSAALLSNTIGTDNTATGRNALIGNTTGSFNTGTGRNALFSNTTGTQNTATGSAALFSNTTGSDNTASGRTALGSNTTGSNNTASGVAALISNTTGERNMANGNFALFSLTTGNDNVADGFSAQQNNDVASANVAIGNYALHNNSGDGGWNNTAVGTAALANAVGGGNTALGVNAGVELNNGRNNIYIGNPGIAAEDNTIRIGGDTTSIGPQTSVYIVGISGAAVGGGVAVRVNSNGKLGTAPSSARFKDGIKPMDKASEAILALKPVTFRYKKEIDAERTPEFGLVAEEVEKVNPDLVARDKQGKPYTVRYEAVNAMLLNEFLKARRQIDAQQKQIEALTAGLQKVSAQLEVSKPALQTVLNNR